MIKISIKCARPSFREKCVSSFWVQYLSGLDFYNNHEKTKIKMLFDEIVTRWSHVDRNLPQIVPMWAYLSLSVAVHHVEFAAYCKGGCQDSVCQVSLLCSVCH